MALLELPPEPPNYQTSLAVRAGISHAYSGLYNPRGLELVWYGPYGHVFHDMALPYNGHLIVHCQYPLWISSLRMTEFKLREEFKENGVAYDSDDEDGDDDEEILAGLHSAEGHRRSERLIELQKSKAGAAAEERIKLVKDLKKRRNELYDIKLDEEDKLDPDISKASAMSQPDPAAVNKQPDFVLSHVAHYDLLAPPSEQEQSHYTHRAGVKVYHHCCPLIAELKSAPARFSKGCKRVNVTSALVLRAQRDLMEYCAAYFRCNGKSTSVVALAGAGLFWRWAVVRRSDLPKFNWKTNKLLKQRDPKARLFHGMFGKEYFTLGTTESDEALSCISQKHIHPMLKSDGHTPRREDLLTDSA